MDVRWMLDGLDRCSDECFQIGSGHINSAHSLRKALIPERIRKKAWTMHTCLKDPDKAPDIARRSYLIEKEAYASSQDYRPLGRNFFQ